LLSDKFCILKPLLSCLYFWLKNRDEGGVGAQKNQGSATDRSALVRYNARALTNQIACYIPFIL
jgi:hypothetical protein